MQLEERIQDLVADPKRSPAALALLAEFRDALNRGLARAASPEGDEWVVHPWVRRAILLHAHLGVVGARTTPGGERSIDYDTLPMREFSAADQVRVAVGAAVRDGAYLGPGAQCLPPSMINVGAYVGPHSLVDSNSMVGACAQVGARVSIGCGSQIGGVLSPEAWWPNILEDDVVVSGNCGVYDGVVIGRGAVLAAGVVLYGAAVVYDATNGAVLTRGEDRPLNIPPNAVVVNAVRRIGSGPLKDGPVQPQCALIAGYRNDGENAADVLRRILA